MINAIITCVDIASDHPNQDTFIQNLQEFLHSLTKLSPEKQEDGLNLLSQCLEKNSDLLSDRLFRLLWHRFLIESSASDTLPESMCSILFAAGDPALSETNKDFLEAFLSKRPDTSLQRIASNLALIHPARKTETFSVFLKEVLLNPRIPDTVVSVHQLLDLFGLASDYQQARRRNRNPLDYLTDLHTKEQFQALCRILKKQDISEHKALFQNPNLSPSALEILGELYHYDPDTPWQVCKNFLEYKPEPPMQEKLQNLRELLAKTSIPEDELRNQVNHLLTENTWKSYTLSLDRYYRVCHPDLYKDREKLKHQYQMDQRDTGLFGDNLACFLLALPNPQQTEADH